MRWVRAVMGLELLAGGWEVLTEAGYGPGSKVTIMPTTDADEALRLLGRARARLTEVEDRSLWDAIDAFLSAHGGEG